MNRDTRKFALIGAAGFVAPRHMEAIQGVGGQLLAALDPHDSVGILDRYAPDCAYFKEPERFWRWMARRNFEGKPKPDWVSVCSPNWLHDAHVRMALVEDCKVILEKPAVLTTRNLDCLMEEFPLYALRPEETSWKNVFVCHQLRWHPDAIAFKRYVRKTLDKDPGFRFKVRIVYHTPRGPWYRYSWKGDMERSGGPISNLGIHFLDLLVWLFGNAQGEPLVVDRDEKRVIGSLIMMNADVEFSLSTRFRDAKGGPKRQFTIDAEHSFRFDTGFTGLHQKVYDSAMRGEGVTLADVREPVRIAERIRLANFCC